MLGKRPRALGSNSGNLHHATKPRPKPYKKVEISDEEGEGRSGIGKKARETVRSNAREATGGDLDDCHGANTLRRSSPLLPTTVKRQGASYLDQVLAERASKKKKRKKQKRDNS